MKFDLKYGQGKRRIEITEKNILGEILPGKCKVVEDAVAEVIESLSNPIKSDRLAEKVNPGDRVVILTSDISRPAPSNILLPPIVNELNESGVDDKNIKVIFGLGVHRKQSSEEISGLLGEELYNRLECLNHDVNKCEYIGTTKRGTRVEVNSEVLNSDIIIATGNLEYHYFAGFSGGAKALAPGVCSKKTIMQNHQHFLEPLARSGQIKGNPVREEIEEIGDMVGIDFMVNAVLNSKKELVKVVAGDITKAHREGKKYIEKIYKKEIDELADIVITSPGGFPKDIDLYQTHKAMENGKSALKDGGIMIVLGECQDGLGEEKFAEALLNDSSPDDLIEELKNKFVLGRHKASRIAMIHKNTDIYLVSSLSNDIKEKLFIKNYTDANNALEDALKEKGSGAKIIIIPYGASTLPELKS